MMRIFWFVLLGLLLTVRMEAACTGSNPTWSTTNDEASIRACVTAATGTGGTVNVAAGTFNWTGDLTITGMTFKGTSTAITFPVHPTTLTLPTNLPDRVITGGTFVFAKHNTQVSRVTGVKMTGTGYQKFRMTGSDTQELAIFDNSYVQYGDVGTLGQQFFFINTCGALLHHMVFDQIAATPGVQVDLSSAKCGSWSDPFTLGNADTTGKKNIYFEDSWVGGMNNNLVDCDDGARVVARHSSFIDSAHTAHGGGTGVNDNDTSIEGCRFFEITNNWFKRMPNGGSKNMNWWVWMRGADLVFANNQLDDIRNGEWNSGTNIKLGVGCTGDTYPNKYQVGQSTTTPTGPPTKPVLFFGNSGAGTSLNFPAAVANLTGGGGHDCANPSSFISLNRDYFMSNQWGYAEFTYPHPAQSQGGGGGDVTPPTDPTVLIGTAISTSRIDLTWTGSTDAVGVTGYPVEQCQGVACVSFVQIASPAVTLYSSTGLSESTTYRYRVRATDAAGNFSGYSNIVTVATLTVPPAAATGLSVR